VGEYLQVVVVAVGLGLLLERSVVAFEVVKLAGATYLVWLGIAAWRKRGDLESALSAGAKAAGTTTGWRLAEQGFFVGASNPKTVIFLSAILPQFVDKAGGHESVQILVLGAVFSSIALASDSLWALAAGAFRKWFASSPRRLRLIGGTGGLAIVAVGVGLALTGRKD
jgi:threonine/homoserine/homoserine lactone efflux protein